MVDSDINTYQKIMEDIIERSDGGKYEFMDFGDKVMVISIMTEIKKAIDNYMRESYPTILIWSNLNIEDIQLQETQPDMSIIDNKIYKLMGI